MNSLVILLLDIHHLNEDQAKNLCRLLTDNLPEYFGISFANEKYFEGVRLCKNLAVKIHNDYVGLLPLNFPYPNNSNIYWMAILREYQRQGIGSALIKKAVHISRKLNANSMSVETLALQKADENYLKIYHFYQLNKFNP